MERCQQWSSSMPTQNNHLGRFKIRVHRAPSQTNLGIISAVRVGNFSIKWVSFLFAFPEHTHSHTHTHTHTHTGISYKQCSFLRNSLFSSIAKHCMTKYDRKRVQNLSMCCPQGIYITNALLSSKTLILFIDFCSANVVYNLHKSVTNISTV